MNSPENLEANMATSTHVPTFEETQDFIRELQAQRNGFLDQATGLAATVAGLNRKIRALESEFAALKAPPAEKDITPAAEEKQ